MAPYLCTSSVFSHFPSASLPPAFLPPAILLLLGMYFSPLHSSWEIFAENGTVEERITRAAFKVAVNKVMLFYSKAADYYLSTIAYLYVQGSGLHRIPPCSSFR